MSLQFDRIRAAYRIDYDDSILHMQNADSREKRMAMTAVCSGYFLPAKRLAKCLPGDAQ
jgi:hypothetical protein